MSSERPALPPPRLNLDPFSIAFLSDGFWLNDGGCMFGVVPRELWRRQHPHDEQNRIRLNLTCPLIVRGSTAILLDTGIGNRLSSAERKIFSHDDGWLIDGLRALGMEAGDITHVLLSHLHFDHCGGMVRRDDSGKLQPAFPKARYLIQRGELHHATQSDNERQRGAYRHVSECIEPIRNLLEVIEGDVEISSGVKALVTGGHTFDHQIAMVSGDRETFVHLADIVPTRSHMKGPWNQAYDLDALRTMEEKARYLSQAAAHLWWISFAHDDRVFTARPHLDSGVFILQDVVEAAVTAA
jgi:glyoxylase-like metal-dependent hydrolase (beta-lactamase superfamily II)